MTCPKCGKEQVTTVCGCWTGFAQERSERDTIRAENERLRAEQNNTIIVYRDAEELTAGWVVQSIDEQAVEGGPTTRSISMRKYTVNPATAHPRLFCPAHGKRLPCAECGTKCVHGVYGECRYCKSVDRPCIYCGKPTAYSVGGLGDMCIEPCGSAHPLSKTPGVVGGFTPRPRRSLFPLTLAAVAVWAFIALRFGWFAEAWAWLSRLLGE